MCWYFVSVILSMQIGGCIDAITLRNQCCGLFNRGQASKCLQAFVASQELQCETTCNTYRCMKEESTLKSMWSCWLLCTKRFILQPKSSQTLPLNRAWAFWEMLTMMSEMTLRDCDQRWCSCQMFTPNHMVIIPKEWTPHSSQWEGWLTWTWALGEGWAQREGARGNPYLCNMHFAVVYLCCPHNTPIAAGCGCLSVMYWTNRLPVMRVSDSVSQSKRKSHPSLMARCLVDALHSL